jgi:hypothetical protein
MSDTSDQLGLVRVRRRIRWAIYSFTTIVIVGVLVGHFYFHIF